MKPTWLVRWDTATDERPSFAVPHEPERFGPGAASDVAFQGYLYDRNQIAIQSPASDAALVAIAYERWQAAVFDKLRGGFAVAIWDQERHRLLVGRDATGLVPCFYSWNGRLLVVSPSLDAILAQPDVHAPFNRVLIAEYVQGMRAFQQPDETFYDGVRRLPAAHTLSMCGSTLSVTRYWEPIPPGFAWATEDELSRFASVFATAVERALAIGADSLALSGGFDSVSIAVMAAQQRRGRGPLRALSLRFTHPSCDEGARQTQVAAALGMPHLMRSLDDCLGVDPFGTELQDLSRVSPGPVMSGWQSMYVKLLRSAADLGLTRLLNGTGGDEMYQVNMGYAADCFAGLELGRLWRFFRACEATWPGARLRVARSVVWDAAVKGHVVARAREYLDRAPNLRDSILRRRLRRACRPWLSREPELRARLERRPLERPMAATMPGDGAYVRAIRMLPQSPALSMELEQSHAWSAYAGFTQLFPYFDRDVVELSLRMRPEHLLGVDGAKAPLRRLIAARLPAVDMPSRKVLFREAFDPLFRVHGRRVWSAQGGARLLAELDIVDPRIVDVGMRRYFDGGGPHSLEAWLIFSMESWLRARSRQR